MEGDMPETCFGSCLCGKVKYKIEGDFDAFFLCHCTRCQKDTGAAHAANLASTSAKLEWVSGQELVTTFALPSTRHQKSFCRECGAALPGYHLEGKLLIAPAGGLDVDVPIAPTAHIFYADKASWEKDLEELKKFEGFPS
jgi:hypothetical protein